MARKKDVLKKIDIKTKATGAPLPLMQGDEIAPPAFYVIPAPDTLVELAQAIFRSTQAALVSVAIGWQEAPNIAPDYYNVEWSESSDFSNVQRRRASTTSATIDGLKANGVTYYFRVQAVLGGIYSEFSNTLIVVTMDDNTPPPEVLAASAAFENSNLIIRYTIPISEIIKDVRINIYNAARTIHYGTFYTRSDMFVWTAEQNIFATGGIPLTQVSVDIHTRSWSNEPSLAGVTVTATAPIPATPTGYSSNWISDNGTASADFITSWLGAAHANDYELTIDGKNYYTRDLKFVYTYEQNVQDHVPTIPSGDPSFVWLLKARDKLGQSSVPVNVTVTNAAPPSGVMSLTVNGGFSTIAATVALLGNTIVQDFDHYEWAISDGTSIIQQFNSPDPMVIFQLNTAGTYTPSVRMVDKFNQKSAVVSGAPTILDTLTIEQLRSETQYTDWLGTASSTLNKLKDGVLYDGSANYVSYAANAGWQWVQATRPLLDRYKTITFSAFWGSTLNFYYQVDTPSGTVYYSGPITISANGSYLMTRYTNQITAQTNAYVFGSAGNGTRRFDFPQIEEARNIRLWFKDTAATFGLYEFYPRRLVQSDDIEAESIRSINVAAQGINADRIFAVTLSSIVAFIGQLNIDATGWLYQGTGTGNSPTTGLKIFNSGGIGKLSTYNSGVEQITLDTDGKLKAGAGAVLLDSNGITVNSRFIAPGYGAPTTTGIKWVFGGLTVTTIEGLVVDDTPDWYTLNFKNDYQANSQTNITASYAINFAAGNAGITLAKGSAGAHGILEFNSTTDIRMNGGDLLVGYTGGGELVVFGNSSITGALAIGSTLNATRNLSIFADNGYMSWNTAAGSEKWVAGFESAGSDRWILYNPNVGYVINARFSDGYITFASGAEFQHDVYIKNGGGTARSLRIYNANATNEGFIYDGGGSGISELRMAPAGVTVAYFNQNGNSSFGQTALAANRVGIRSATSDATTGGLFVTNSSTTLLLQNLSDGQAKVSQAWQIVSDVKTKKDIAKLDHGIDKLKLLKPKKYKTNLGDVDTFGLIAQDVQAIFPEMVGKHIEEDGTEVLTLRYNDLIPVLINAVNELSDQLEVLKKK